MEGAPIFILKEKRGIKYYQIQSFNKTGVVDHCFSTRLGGISTKNYSSLNLGLHVNDEQQKVINNRKLLVNLFSNSVDDLVAAKQVHGTNVKVVDQEDCGRGAVDYKTALSNTDALITAQKGVLLSSYYADCTPLFFLAPNIPAVGLAHAGWKGTVNKIGQKTALQMKENWGIDLQKLLVGIGPHIGSCCYQVGKEVVRKFAAAFDNSNSFIETDQAEKWRLDLAKANHIQLEEIGVKTDNISISNLCTSCRDDLFYSYRRDNGQTGRMASIIKIR